jgi:hypothetical protein
MEEKKQSIRDAYLKYMKNPDLEADKLVACLENYRTKWVNERKSSQDSIWRESIAFYSGNHSIRESSTSNSYRVRLRENHTNNILNRMISVFVQNLPIVRVFPSTVQNEDVANAEATEAYGKYIWRTKKIEQQLVKFLKHTSIFGNGFTWRRYDPDVIGEVRIDASESESGEPMTRMFRGDSKLTIVDPFKIAPRPGIDEMDDMYDIIVSEPVNRQDLEAKHGKIETPAASALDVYTGKVRTDDDMAVQHHYYHKPTPWFPEGLYACWTGKKLLKARKASKCEKKLPIDHLGFDKVPLKFWAMASIEQVMDLQEQLNRASGMIVEARNLIARPRAFVSNQSKMPAQSITDRPGDIMRYDIEGGKPEFFVPSFNFAELSAHKADLRATLSSILGMSQASRGEIPQATRTALALQLVLEQDRSQYLPFIKGFHQSIIDIMQGLFEIAAEYFDESDPRVIKLEGEEGSKLFSGHMVPSPLDIYLEDTNPLGWTAAGRIEQVGNLIDRKVITDRNHILDMLKINSPDPAFALKRINKQAALKEIERLNKGEPIDIGPEDDDPVHMDEHVKVIASFNFRFLPGPVRDAHLAHAAQHKERLQALMPAAPAPGQGDPRQLPSAEAQAEPGLLAPPETGQNMEELLSA